MFRSTLPRLLHSSPIAKKPFTIGLIPADGIGKEVIPAAEKVLNAVGKFKFISLDAGFEHFKATGVALPDETVAALKEKCDGALFGYAI